MHASASGSSAAVAGANSKVGAGLFGLSDSGPGVAANSTSGDGVDAVSLTGEGVFGVSDSGFGMYGFSNKSLGVFGVSENYHGVYGDAVGSGVGVFGLSQSGNGVEGSASAGDAVHAANNGTGTALAALANTGDAIYAFTNGNGTSGSLGMFAMNANGNGADIRGSYIGLTGRAPSGTTGFPLVATDLSGNNLFWVDGNGNVFYRGSLNSFARTASGAMATEFVPSTTAPTVEDNGSAQLVNGQGVVKLDPAFAATIDMHRPYRVFLTPSGDTRGLYVAAKTVSGFVVRETQGGHSSLSFDYRILANGAGHANERLGLLATSRSWPNAQLGTHHVGKTTAPLSQAALNRAIQFTKTHFTKK